LENFVFDLIVVGVIVISAVMSLGRGLVREATSVLSFIVGGVVAYYSLVFFKKPLEDLMPDGWGTITPSILLVVVGFVAAYTLAAWLGGRLSKVLHSSPEIGVLDRLAGGAFGVARGVLAGVLFVLLIQQILPANDVPAPIARSRTYPYLSAAADGIRKVVPGWLPQAVDNSGNLRIPARSPTPADRSNPT
jgi:membrane protein required for colicin V production